MGALEGVGSDPGEAGVPAQGVGFSCPSYLHAWPGMCLGVCVRVTNQPIVHSVLPPVRSEGKEISPYMDTQSLHKLREAKLTQSGPTLCDPMDYRVHGIFQARTPQWVTVPFSRGSSQPGNWTQVSCIADRFFTSWTIREAREHRSGEPVPSPGDLPGPGIEPRSPALWRILYQLSHQGRLYKLRMWHNFLKVQPLSPRYLKGRLNTV